MSRVLELAKELVRELEKDTCDKVQLSEIPEGGRFKTGIGNFIILEQKEDSAVVITEDLYREDVEFDKNCADYKESDLRELCEGKIYEDFWEEFGVENILEHETDLVTVDNQNAFGKISAKVRPLTFDEARKYNKFLVNKDLKDWYWTCTSWSAADRDWPYSVTVVSPSGLIFSNGCDYGNGVRPLCILKSNIFVSKVEKESHEREEYTER